MDLQKASREIDDFIARRAEQNAAELEREAAWAASVRRYNARRRRETLWQKLNFHQAMLASHTRTFEDLLERHRAGVARCEELLGIEPDNREEIT